MWPSRSIMKQYSPSCLLVGRESSLVKLIPLAENWASIDSSDPGRSVTWKQTTVVLSFPVGLGM